MIPNKYRRWYCNSIAWIVPPAGVSASVAATLVDCQNQNDRFLVFSIFTLLPGHKKPLKIYALSAEDNGNAIYGTRGQPIKASTIKLDDHPFIILAQATYTSQMNYPFHGDNLNGFNFEKEEIVNA